MDWKECCGKRIVKNVQQDPPLIQSLLKSSANKLQSQHKLPLEEVTAASVLSLAYDSLRELLEVLALQQGFKVYNHECYTAFLKEIMRLSNEGDEFDSIRKERNAVNYYGKEISVPEVKILSGRIHKLRLCLEKKVVIK